jgi:hypothetical protein
MGDHNDLLTLRKLLKKDGAVVLELPVKGAVLKASVYLEKHKNHNLKSQAAPHLVSNADIIRMMQWEQEISVHLLRDIIQSCSSSNEDHHAHDDDERRQQQHQQLKAAACPILEGHEYIADAVYLKVPGKGKKKFSTISLFSGQLCNIYIGTKYPQVPAPGFPSSFRILQIRATNPPLKSTSRKWAAGMKRKTNSSSNARTAL